MMQFRGPRTVQVGSGPNFRKFFSSVYSGLKPLFSSAVSALKGSAKEAGKDILFNFGQKDFGDLIRGAGTTFVDDLRNRAVSKINRTGQQTGSGYGRGYYKRGVNVDRDLFGVNPYTYSGANRRARSIKGGKRKVSKKTIKRRRKPKTKRKRSVQVGKGKRRRTVKKKARKTIKKVSKRRSKKIRQLDIFS